MAQSTVRCRRLFVTCLRAAAKHGQREVQVAEESQHLVGLGRDPDLFEALYREHAKASIRSSASGMGGPDAMPLTGKRRTELSQVEAGANAVRDECWAEPGVHRVLSPPSSAVCGDQDSGVQDGEVVEYAWNEGLEEGSVEMESAEQGVQRLVAGEPLGVAGDVDHTGVAAPGEDHQAFAPQVQDECLVVKHEGVGLPVVV